MPRPQKRPRDRRPYVGQGHEMQMLTGFSMNPLMDNFGDLRTGECNMEAMREAWDALGEELTERWIESGHAGTRPYCWWLWDALEPRRRRVDGKVHPMDDPVRADHVLKIARTIGDKKVRDRYVHDAQALTSGVPKCQMVPNDFGAVYETEDEYLQRLNLLSDRERQLLARSA